MSMAIMSVADIDTSFSAFFATTPEMIQIIAKFAAISAKFSAKKRHHRQKRAHANPIATGATTVMRRFRMTSAESIWILAEWKNK